MIFITTNCWTVYLLITPLYLILATTLSPQNTITTTTLPQPHYPINLTTTVPSSLPLTLLLLLSPTSPCFKPSSPHHHHHSSTTSPPPLLHHITTTTPPPHHHHHSSTTSPPPLLHHITTTTPPPHHHHHSSTTSPLPLLQPHHHHHITTTTSTTTSPSTPLAPSAFSLLTLPPFILSSFINFASKVEIRKSGKTKNVNGKMKNGSKKTVLKLK